MIAFPLHFLEKVVPNDVWTPWCRKHISLLENLDYGYAPHKNFILTDWSGRKQVIDSVIGCAGCVADVLQCIAKAREYPSVLEDGTTEILPYYWIRSIEQIRKNVLQGAGNE